MSDSESSQVDAIESTALGAAVERATVLTKRTLALFPVRVWRHFLQSNGFLLAAGVSYQALFAIFAAVYLAFAIVGIWLGGNEDAVAALIVIINGYIPNLIADEGGLATPDQVMDIATTSAGVLSITGLVAVVAVIWTAIGWVTFSRRAVRDMFGLPPDRRAYVILKARDLLAALIFGVALVSSAVLTSFSAMALRWLLSLLGWDAGSDVLNLLIRLGAVVISFALMSAALAALMRFLTGTSLRWRTIWPGALLGGGAMTVLQFGAGFLLSYTPSNPLLVTFAFFIGLLLWFRMNGVVMLVAAAWIAVAAQDRDLPLLRQTESERIAAEYAAQVSHARERLHEARESWREAPWFGRWGARQAVRSAEDELDQLLANPPEPVPVATASDRILAELSRMRKGVGRSG